MYKIVVSTTKFPEGYMWRIFADDVECGSGYSDTVDDAFAEAKVYLATLTI